MHVAMALSQSPTIHISFFSYELIAHDGARADRNEAHGAQGNCPTTHLPHPTCYMICICAAFARSQAWRAMPGL